MLQPFWLPFLLHLRLEMSLVSLLVSVPTPSSAFTHRTHNHIATNFHPMPVRLYSAFVLFWLELSQVYYITCKFSVVILVPAL